MDRLAILQILLREYTAITPILPPTSFEDLQMDSYAVVDFMLKVEEQFGIVLDDENLLRVKTIQDVLKVIQEDTEEGTC